MKWYTSYLSDGKFIALIDLNFKQLLYRQKAAPNILVSAKESQFSNTQNEKELDN